MDCDVPTAMFVLRRGAIFQVGQSKKKTAWPVRGFLVKHVALLFQARIPKANFVRHKRVPNQATEGINGARERELLYDNVRKWMIHRDDL